MHVCTGICTCVCKCRDFIQELNNVCYKLCVNRNIPNLDTIISCSLDYTFPLRVHNLQSLQVGPPHPLEHLHFPPTTQMPPFLQVKLHNITENTTQHGLIIHAEIFIINSLTRCYYIVCMCMCVCVCVCVCACVCV